MVKLLSKIESNGIKVNDIYLKKLSKNFEDKLKKIEKKIYSTVLHTVILLIVIAYSTCVATW